jgi:hypothetical protein
VPTAAESSSPNPGNGGRFAFVAAWVIVGLTVAQLAVAALASSSSAVQLDQFEGKAFGARLIAYPLVMLLLPAIWWTARRRRGGDAASQPLPWAAFAWIMLPFLVDVTGNSLNLYDTVTWWDDANHLVNWFFLSLGLGLLLARANVSPRWLLGLAITGLGAILAIGWELAEWYTFIRHGTELNTAYTDTLGDEALGTLGAFIAALVVLRITD